jgi:cytochrome b6-f complex iron-sulfur subunit
MQETRSETVPGNPVSKPAAPAGTTAPRAGRDGAGAVKDKPAPPKTEPPDDDKTRRRLVWTAVTAFLVTNFLMFLRFFFPRTLFEPSTRFRIGYPADFGLGVDERYKQSHRIWVVRLPDRLFVIAAKCTHLGCTPNWIESENKFKCPCHGSGYDLEGRNFEGPAPRPMDRAYVELDAEGQIVVDTSRLYQCVPGGKCGFETEPNAFVIVS